MLKVPFRPEFFSDLKVTTAQIVFITGLINYVSLHNTVDLETFGMLGKLVAEERWSQLEIRLYDSY